MKCRWLWSLGFVAGIGCGVMTSVMMNKDSVLLSGFPRNFFSVGKSQTLLNVLQNAERHSHTSIPMYYVNLDRSVLRREHMERTFGAWGKLTRVPAIDGSNSTQVEEAIDTHGMDVESYRQAVNATTISEVMVVASHIKAIKMAKDNGDQVMLLLEDDMSDMLVPHWRWGLDDVVRFADLTHPHWDLIQLHVCYIDKDRKFYDNWKMNIHSPILSREHLPNGAAQSTYGTGAMLISSRGMATLSDLLLSGSGGRFDCLPLRRFQKQLRPVICIPDKLYYRLQPPFEALLALPPLFTYTLNEGSTGIRSSRERIVNDHYMFHYSSTLESLKSNLEAAAAFAASEELSRDVNITDLPYVKSDFRFFFKGYRREDMPDSPLF